jgi:hypothetical protein
MNLWNSSGSDWETNSKTSDEMGVLYVPGRKRVIIEN